MEYAFITSVIKASALPLHIRHQRLTQQELLCLESFGTSGMDTIAESGIDASITQTAKVLLANHFEGDAPCVEALTIIPINQRPIAAGEDGQRDHKSENTSAVGTRF